MGSTLKYDVEQRKRGMMHIWF